MPARLAARFTPGELAALRIIADEVRDHGKCDLPLGKIAACAGVGRTTVQNAIRVAVRFGLMSVQERRLPGARSLPNIIRIISAEWRSWLERGRKRGGYKIPNPTNKLGFNRVFRNTVAAAAGRTPRG